MGYKTDAAKGIGAGWLLVIILGVLGLLTGAIFWGIGVATSNAKGAGDTIIKNNSVENRTEKQEKFEKLFAKVETNKALVAQHTKTVAANPTDKQASMVLSGVQSACVASVEQYNAEARKVLSMDWKAADLPDSLTTTGCN
jgi:predicted lipid-binding transport protein (Tim44 family)